MKTIKLLLGILLTVGLSFTGYSQPGKHHHKQKYYSKHHASHYRHVKQLPSRHYSTHYRGARYYYNEGYYYRPQHNGYVRIHPPYGLRVRSLPPGHRTKFYRGKRYYYARNVYYQSYSPGIYIVINRPW